MADYEFDVSVIVPALDLNPKFVATVRGLAEQKPELSFEILVVLNEAERPVDIVFPKQCRLLFCATAGSYAARNAGIRAARGRVLAFTDSDAEPSLHWLREGYAAIETLDFNMVVAGAVQSYRRRKTAAGAYDLLFYLNQRQGAVNEGVAGTVNLWVPAEIMQKLGGFDGGMYSCGDMEFCQRARSAGFRLAFADDAAVRHPARDSLLGLLEKERRVAGGLVSLARVRKKPLTLRYHAKREMDFWAQRARVIRSLPHRSPKLRLHGVSCVVAFARLCERLCVLSGKRPRRI